MPKIDAKKFFEQYSGVATVLLSCLQFLFFPKKLCHAEGFYPARIEKNRTHVALF
jgi:hypothetical protein